MGAIFGINFSPLGLEDLVARLVSEPVPTNEGARLVVTANLDHVVHLARNGEFKEAYSRAWAATADGAPVFLYARLRGADLPARVPGPDLFAALMPRLSEKDHRPFFVVSNLATGGQLRNWLISRGFDSSAIGVSSPAFGFEHDEVSSNALAAQIKNHRTTHLILGVGAPKSEIWVDRHRYDVGDCYAMGIGAGVDFFAGVERRAPLWMQRVGLEWFWRFVREPRRLFRRYFVDSWGFFVAVKKDLLDSSSTKT